MTREVELNHSITSSARASSVGFQVERLRSLCCCLENYCVISTSQTDFWGSSATWRIAPLAAATYFARALRRGRKVATGCRSRPSSLESQLAWRRRWLPDRHDQAIRACATPHRTPRSTAAQQYGPSWDSAFVPCVKRDGSRLQQPRHLDSGLLAGIVG